MVLSAVTFHVQHFALNAPSLSDPVAAVIGQPEPEVRLSQQFVPVECVQRYQVVWRPGSAVTELLQSLFAEIEEGSGTVICQFLFAMFVP